MVRWLCLQPWGFALPEVLHPYSPDGGLDEQHVLRSCISYTVVKPTAIPAEGSQRYQTIQTQQTYRAFRLVKALPYPTYSTGQQPHASSGTSQTGMAHDPGTICKDRGQDYPANGQHRRGHRDLKKASPDFRPRRCRSPRGQGR